MIPDFKIQTADGKNGIPGKIRLGDLKGIGNVKTHYPPSATRRRRGWQHKPHTTV
jgi:hypothetical protein